MTYISKIVHGNRIGDSGTDATVLLVGTTSFLFLCGASYLYFFLGYFGIPSDSFGLESHKIILLGAQAFFFFYLENLWVLFPIVFVESIALLALNVKKNNGCELSWHVLRIHRSIYRELNGRYWGIWFLFWPIFMVFDIHGLARIIQYCKKHGTNFQLTIAAIFFLSQWGVIAGFGLANSDAKMLFASKNQDTLIQMTDSELGIAVKYILCSESKCAFYLKEKDVSYVISNDQLRQIQYSPSQFSVAARFDNVFCGRGMLSIVFCSKPDGSNEGN